MLSCCKNKEDGNNTKQRHGKEVCRPRSDWYCLSYVHGTHQAQVCPMTLIALIKSAALEWQSKQHKQRNLAEGPPQAHCDIFSWAPKSLTVPLPLFFMFKASTTRPLQPSTMHCLNTHFQSKPAFNCYSRAALWLPILDCGCTGKLPVLSRKVCGFTEQVTLVNV